MSQHEDLELGQHGYREVVVGRTGVDLGAPTLRRRERPLDISDEPDERFNLWHDSGDNVYVVEAHTDDVLDAVRRLEQDGELTIVHETFDDNGLIMVVPNLESRAEHDQDEPLHASNPCNQIAELITGELDQLVSTST